jgi:hypothetical protein
MAMAWRSSRPPRWAKENNSGMGQTRSSRTRRSATLVSRTAFCVLAGISESQLTLWEHEELIASVPDEAGLERLYDESALRRARVIRTLAEDLGVNLPGIDVILNLLDQIDR